MVLLVPPEWTSIKSESGHELNCPSFVDHYGYFSSSSASEIPFHVGMSAEEFACLAQCTGETSRTCRVYKLNSHRVWAQPIKLLTSRGLEVIGKLAF